MADLFATGLQIVDLAEGQARPAELEKTLRVYGRGANLYGRNSAGDETRLTGDFYTAELYGTAKAERDQLHHLSAVVQTNAQGDATFTFPQAFTALPAITAVAVATSTTVPTLVEITAGSETSVSVRTYRPRAASLLNNSPAERVTAQVVITATGFLA